MNFEELYKPYETKTAPSVGSQITWLQREGFNSGIIDQSLLKVYSEIKNGKTFADTKTLWLYLRDIAREFQKAEADLHVRHLEEFHSNLKDSIDIEWNKLSKWQKIKAVLKGEA